MNSDHPFINTFINMLFSFYFVFNQHFTKLLKLLTNYNTTTDLSLL